MTCDDYQIAFEQQLAGPPGPIAPAELEAHVAACASCAAYLTVSRKVSESMSTALSLSPAPLGLEAMRERIALEHRRARRGYWFAPLIAVAVMVLTNLEDLASLRTAVAVTIGALVGGAVGAAVWHAVSRRRLANLAALERASGGQLVDGFRQEIERTIRDARFALWFVPAMTAVGLILDGNLLRGERPGLMWLVLIPLTLASLPISAVRLRRARRERATLGA
jgi:hypothetical protein